MTGVKPKGEHVTGILERHVGSRAETRRADRYSLLLAVLLKVVTKAEARAGGKAEA